MSIISKMEQQIKDFHDFLEMMAEESQYCPELLAAEKIARDGAI